SFVSYTMLYSAAVTFSESARRLGRGELGFLATDHSEFGPTLQNLLRHPSADLYSAVQEAIEPINVAGLQNPAHRNWYPVHAQDLLDNCAKLGIKPDAVLQMLARTGFYGPNAQKCQTIPA